MTETRYEHIMLADDGVPMIAGTKMKVVGLVLDHIAYGWSPEQRQRVLRQVHPLSRRNSPHGGPSG